MINDYEIATKRARRGSIALARSLCVEIAGFTGPDQDLDGNEYGSVDIAEILSEEVVRLRKEIESLKIELFDCRQEIFKIASGLPR
jgi:hypothetical protein